MKRKLSEYSIPKGGDVKTKVNRAWLPKKVDNTLIWFEQYEELFVYEERDVKANISNKAVDFRVGEWVKVSERLIKWEIVSTNG